MVLGGGGGSYGRGTPVRPPIPAPAAPASSLGLGFRCRELDWTGDGGHTFDRLAKEAASPVRSSPHTTVSVKALVSRPFDTRSVSFQLLVAVA